MRVLVTGGAGYIGSHVVMHLRADGHEPIVLDDLRTGHAEATLGARLVVGDVRDRALLHRLFSHERIDAVIHLAGMKSVTESLLDPASYFDNNVSGSLVLLTAMRRAEVGIIVFSSSCSVYGQPERLPINERSPRHPSTPYGETKLMVEQMLRWFARCHGLRFAALRYFNAAGASLGGEIGEDWNQATNLVPVVMKAALGRIPAVQVFGTDYPTPDGTAVRDYIHVSDLADAHVLALNHLAVHDQALTFNVGTGVGASVLEVIDAARRASGRDVPSQLVERRAGDPAAVWADAKAIRAQLGWHPRFGLEEIVTSAWRWHHAHPDGYTPSA